MKSIRKELRNSDEKERTQGKEGIWDRQKGEGMAHLETGERKRP